MKTVAVEPHNTKQSPQNSKEHDVYWRFICGKASRKAATPSKEQFTRWELPVPELLVTITGTSTHAKRMDQVVYEAIKH
eukprot:1344498-Rhodomonas_salina.1